MSKKLSHLNVCYSTNEDFAQHTLVSITSLLENNSLSEKIIIHIFYADLKHLTITRFSSLENHYRNAKVEFHKIDATRFERFDLTILHITKETYFRYLIADILSDVNYVLYLDGDTIVNADISELFDIDLSGFYCAGVRDIYIQELGYKKTLGLGGLYINAGVILFNLDEMRKSNIADTLFKLSTENNFKFQDQDAINIAFNGKIKELDCIYNYKRMHQKRFYRKAKDAKIIHYVGPNKPWKKFTFNRLKRLYFKYRKKTPFINKKIKVGLLVDEYFGAWRTAFGGYGFLAREIVAKNLPCEDIELEVIIGKQKNNPFWASSRLIDDIKVWRLPRLDCLTRRWLKRADYDCWLSIEMCYDFILRLDPNSNRRLILWIQDPRPISAWEKIGEMKKIEDHSFYNQKNYDQVKRWFDMGRVKFITQGETLSPLARELYSFSSKVEPDIVPNPVFIEPNFSFNIEEKEKIVVFLGRLEAQKRAWIFCEIAKLMPEYQFYVIGKFYRYRDENENTLRSYLDGKIKNLHFCGHLFGKEKVLLLKRARVLVNTSIWEGIPISWLEALSYGTVIISAFDRENIVKRFGKYIGEIKGDGENSANLFVPHIKSFLEDDVLYEKNANQAIDYIKENHAFNQFKKKIRNIIRKSL